MPTIALVGSSMRKNSPMMGRVGGLPVASSSKQNKQSTSRGPFDRIRNLTRVKKRRKSTRSAQSRNVTTAKKQ